MEIENGYLTLETEVDEMIRSSISAANFLLGISDGHVKLLSQGLCCNNHNCSQEEKRGPDGATASVVHNNQIIIWPKGAPALFEVGLDSQGDDTRQLNNAALNRYLSTLSQQFVFFRFLVFPKNCGQSEGDMAAC